MKNKTLILKKGNEVLWIDEGSRHTACIWNVTSVEKIKETDAGGVRIFSNGKQIGIIWHVKEIKETWT